MTPMASSQHEASRGRDANLVKLLQDSGAKINRENVHGETGLDIARQLGWEHGMMLLTL